MRECGGLGIYKAVFLQLEALALSSIAMIESLPTATYRGPGIPGTPFTNME